MRHLIRPVLVSALLLAPAAAFAWPEPALPEDAARQIAWEQGVVTITDIDATIDGDWDIEGTDAGGNEVELVIDGATGAIEDAEMNTN